jgi:hypothetical protein
MPSNQICELSMDELDLVDGGTCDTLRSCGEEAGGWVARQVEKVIDWWNS